MTNAQIKRCSTSFVTKKEFAHNTHFKCTASIVLYDNPDQNRAFLPPKSSLTSLPRNACPSSCDLLRLSPTLGAALNVTEVESLAQLFLDRHLLLNIWHRRLSHELYASTALSGRTFGLLLALGFYE